MTMDTARRTVLAKFALSDADFLARGMEAEVYRYGDDAVLKLYASTASLTDLRRLQVFYSTIDRSQLSYALPTILAVFDEGAYQVTVERRLAGQPLVSLLQRTHPHQLDALFASYASAVLELSTIGMPPTTTAYKLFDPHQLSERSERDWHQFLRRWLRHQLRVLTPYFERDVDDFPSKLSAMMALLAAVGPVEERLIHGDICPGNLLVAPDGKPLALLDFGLITMYGDPLFDAATAWVFFDMYERLGANVRERLLPFFLDLLGAKATGRLYRYVLLYSLLSANTYDLECRDGHYAWCIANLNTEAYWDAIE